MIALSNNVRRFLRFVYIQNVKKVRMEYNWNLQGQSEVTRYQYKCVCKTCKASTIYPSRALDHQVLCHGMQLANYGVIRMEVTKMFGGSHVEKFQHNDLGKGK